MLAITDWTTDTHGILASLPCSLPDNAIPQDCNPHAVADSFTKHLSSLNEEHLTEKAIWRDSFALLPGTLRTFYSSGIALIAWQQLCVVKGACDFSETALQARIVRLPLGSCWVEGTYSFRTASTPASSCTIVVALTTTKGRSWKAWMFGTVLNKFIGAPDPDSLSPISIVQHDNTINGSSKGPFGCVVVGAAQAGLSVAGRLKALEVPYVVLDKHRRVGDS